MLKKQKVEVNTTKSKKRFEDVFGNVIIIAILASAFALRQFYKPIRVSGHSMDTTLNNGMIGYSEKVNESTELKRGDIVVVETNDHYIIKRIIGLPNETISCSGGVVYINGVSYSEDYISSETSDFDEVVLGDNEYFVMGDNRSNSKDSREIGAITRDSIISKGIFVINSISKFGSAK